ncbi:MAG: hypothetical protein SGPRY_014754 [Prymnesium sp.]
MRAFVERQENKEGPDDVEGLPDRFTLRLDPIQFVRVICDKDRSDGLNPTEAKKECVVEHMFRNEVIAFKMLRGWQIGDLIKLRGAHCEITLESNPQSKVYAA